MSAECHVQHNNHITAVHTEQTETYEHNILKHQLTCAFITMKQCACGGVSKEVRVSPASSAS